MPEMDGYAATVELKRVLPRTAVLVLTSQLERDSVTRALKAGANGYLLKSMPAAGLCQAVKAASKEPVYIAAEALDLIIDKTTASPSTSTLSEREKEVLIMVAQGKANKQIALRLQLSEGTIKTHVSTILAKLGMQSRTQAALYAANAGWIQQS